MSRFYGTLQGNRGAATRCGTTDISVAAQSWDGSVLTTLRYDKDHNLEVRLSVSDSSTASSWGSTEIFRGSLTELTEVLTKYKARKLKKAERKIQCSE